MDYGTKDHLGPVNQTQIREALGCERYYLLRYRWGLRAKTKAYTPSADVGKLYHRIQQVGDLTQVAQEVRDQQEALKKQVEAGADLTGDLARSIQGLTDAFNKARMMVELWRQRFPEQEGIEVIAREQVITVPTGYGFDLRAQCDTLLGDRRTPGRYATWVQDWKTSSLTFEDVLTGYEWGLQRRCYRLAADTWLKEQRQPATIGFWVNWTKIPNIKCCATDEKNAKKWACDVDEAYLRRCREWYADNGQEAMRSVALIHTEERVPWELRGVFNTMRALRGLEPVPANFSRDLTCKHCRNFRRTCQFYPLCQMSTDAWPDMIPERYEETDSLYDDDRDITEETV